MTVILAPFPQIEEHGNASPGKADAHQADPERQIGVIAGLWHVHSDLLVMNVDRERFVGDQGHGDRVGDLIALAGTVLQLRHHILADAQVFNEDLTVSVRGEGHVVAVGTGHAEGKALFLSVAGGLDDFQRAFQRLVDEAFPGLVFDFVGFAVGINKDIVGIPIQHEPAGAVFSFTNMPPYSRSVIQ